MDYKPACLPQASTKNTRTGITNPSDSTQLCTFKEKSISVGTGEGARWLKSFVMLVFSYKFNTLGKKE